MSRNLCKTPYPGGEAIPDSRSRVWVWRFSWKIGHTDDAVRSFTFHGHVVFIHSSHEAEETLAWIQGLRAEPGTAGVAPSSDRSVDP